VEQHVKKQPSTVDPNLSLLTNHRHTLGVDDPTVRKNRKNSLLWQFANSYWMEIRPTLVVGERNIS